MWTRKKCTFISTKRHTFYLDFLCHLVIASTLEVDDQLTRQQCITKNGAITTANALAIKEAENIFDKCKAEKKKQFLKDHCAEIVETYAPLGLMDEVSFTNTLEKEGSCNVPKPNKEIPIVTINPNLPTVMMVGESGEGKSYLCNALHGEINANYGPFSVGQSVSGK